MGGTGAANSGSRYDSKYGVLAMAHEIDTTGGVERCVFARQPAWHGLGKVVPEAMTSEEAIKHAGLDWAVDLRPIFRKSNNNDLIAVKDRRAVVRVDSDTELGIVGMQYQPVQNTELGGFMDLVLGQGAKYDSAGSLHGGKRVWLNAKVKDCFEVIPNDLVESYIAVLNGHDGNLRMMAVATGTRVVCANTFQLVMDESKYGKNRSIAIRHDGKLKDNVETARVALGLVRTATERMEFEAKALLKIKMDDEALAKFYVDQVRSLKLTKERAEAVVSELVTLQHSKTNTLRGMEGTGWQAYNVWSEWTDHSTRRTGKDVRLESTWYGEGSRSKINAWDQLLQQAV